MPKKVVDLDTAQAIAKLQALISLADQFAQKLQAASTALGSFFGSNAGAPANVASQYAPGAASLNAAGQQVGVPPAAIATAPLQPGGGSTVPGSQQPAAASAGQSQTPAVVQASSNNGTGSSSNAPPLTVFSSSNGNMQPLVLAGAYGVARVAGQAFDFQTERILHGGDDPLGRASMQAGLLSTGLGIVAGLGTGNPVIGAAVGGIANQVLNPLLQYLAAPEAARQQNALSVAGVLNTLTGDPQKALYFTANQSVPGLVGPNQAQDGTSRLAIIGRFANQFQPIENQFGPDGAGIGSIFSNVASALYAGGVDPLTYSEQFKGDLNVRTATINLRKLVFGREGGLRYDTKRVGYEPDETLAETYTRRIASLYGKAGVDSATRQIAPILASLPELGGDEVSPANIADVLTQHGAEATLSYLRLQNDQFIPAVSADTLRTVGADIRTGDRLAKKGALQARNSGEIVARTLRGELSDVASLPGGADSLVYAEKNAALRDARFQQFHQEDLTLFANEDTYLQGRIERQQISPYQSGAIPRLAKAAFENTSRQIERIETRLKDRTNLTEEQESSLISERESLTTRREQQRQTFRASDFDLGNIERFDLADVRLHTEQQRLQNLPFSPGDVFANSVGILRNNQAQIGRLTAYLRQPDLSEQERLQRTQQIGQLEVENSRNYALLTDGVENRIPALAAGRPSMSGLFDSQQLAALAVFRVGSPIRTWGAINGRQAAEQNAYAHALAGDMSIGPRSRTQNLNNGLDGTHVTNGSHDSAGDSRSAASTSSRETLTERTARERDQRYGPHAPGVYERPGARPASPQAPAESSGSGAGHAYPQMPSGAGNETAVLQAILQVLVQINAKLGGNTGASMPQGTRFDQQVGQLGAHISQRDQGTSYNGRRIP